MKKKTILFCIALFSGMAMNATVFVTQSHGNWWGFRYVMETYDNANYMLSCRGYGWLKCKFHVLNPEIRSQAGFGNLTDESLDIIDATVIKSVTETNTSGKFVYNSEFVVKYSYDKDADKLDYTIYSWAEAKAAGLL